MRRIIFMGVMLFAISIGSQAMAACSEGNGWTQVTSLVSTLTGNGLSLGMTACSSTGQGTQEEHHYTGGTSGELWDYKCGNAGAAPVPNTVCAKPGADVRSKLGTWSVANDVSTNATVTYHYTAFGNDTSPALTVYTDGTNYDFCNGVSSAGIFTLEQTTGTARVCPGP